jgi:hypothetical protein
MLYDPKWQIPTKTRSRPSIAGLIAWLEEQPAETKYEWMSPMGCLVCKYYEAEGFQEWGDRKWFYRDAFGGSVDDYHFVGGTAPWTFGAALARARVLRRARAANVKVILITNRD